MKLRFWHRPPAPSPWPVSNPTAIAIGEYEVYGVVPQPGTLAYATIALRNAFHPPAKDPAMPEAEMTTQPTPATPAEAAQLIADAYNAATAAGFRPYRADGHICCARGTGPTFESAEIYEDHEGVWRLIGGR